MTGPPNVKRPPGDEAGRTLTLVTDLFDGDERYQATAPAPIVQERWCGPCPTS